jgi:hypothetical protein
MSWLRWVEVGSPLGDWRRLGRRRKVEVRREFGCSWFMARSLIDFISSVVSVTNEESR